MSDLGEISLADEQYMDAGTIAAQLVEDEFNQVWNATGNPFSEVAAEFKITNPVSVHQLVHEIKDSQEGLEIQVAANHPTSPEGFDTVQNSSYEIASSEHPAYIYVIPKDIDVKAIHGVIEAHVPNAQWGMTDDQIQDQRFLEKIESADELSPGEMREALRALLLLIRS